MAKGNIALGKFRGKVGGQVLRVDAGIGQIISEYNPHPSNPRTLAQTVQRNKMNLAGQISKLTPYGAIAGLDSNRRKARSMFVSDILKNVSTDGGELNAQLNTGLLTLSVGERIYATGTLAQTSGTNRITVTVTLGQASVPILGKLVVVYISNRSRDIYCHMANLGANVNNFEFQVPDSWVSGGEEVVAQGFVIPILDKGDAARVAYGQLTLMPNGWHASAVRTLVSAGAYGASVPLPEWEAELE